MKKVITILFLLVLLTGCGKKKVEKIECHAKGLRFLYGTFEEQVYLELTDNELTNVVQKDIYTLDDINIPHIDVYEEKLTKEIEEQRKVYNYKIDYEMTDTGSVVTMTLTKDQASEFFGFGNKYSRDKIIASLRSAGYSCND